MRGLACVFLLFFLVGCASSVRVRRGDTLYSISRKYDVPVRALIQENKIPSPYIIKVGQRLMIPKQKTYTVCRKDTLYSIAKRFDMSVNQLARQNKIEPPYLLKPGQELVIQSWEEAVAKTSYKTAGSAPYRKEIKVPKSAKNKKFASPVKGKIVQKFGPSKNGSYNDGINISAQKGTPILAADKGTVAYAGSDLKGYGRLVLVRHEGNWFTAYAHADKILVKKGQAIKAGQKIATVGQSGGVKTPQLHFEVRYKTKPVNPLAYLK